MKSLIYLSFIIVSSWAQAKSIEPISGLELKCNDDVANLTYRLKIIDIGDKEGRVTIFKNGKILYRHQNVQFDEHSEGSLFLVAGSHSNGESDFWGIEIPNNNLSEAFYFDGGDSRGLDCKIVK